MKENLIQGYIYKITNLQNNLSYIGKTTYKNINKRFQQHKYYALVLQKGSKTTIHQAIRDYGEDSFSKNVLLPNGGRGLGTAGTGFLVQHSSNEKDRPLVQAGSLEYDGNNTERE